MRRSLLLLLLLPLSSAVLSCAARKPTPHPVRYTERSATLYFTPGIKLMALDRMPPGFLPLNRSPIWLDRDSMIGVVGTLNGRTEILAYSGIAWRRHRPIAADFTPPNDGEIVDVAASPDGTQLVTLVASAATRTRSRHYSLILEDLQRPTPARVVASFDGDFAWSSLKWLNDSTIALALPGAPNGGLYIVKPADPSAVARVNTTCPLTPLQWDSNGTLAIGLGATGVPPVLLDRSKPACAPLRISAPMRALGWNLKYHFILYAAPAARAHSAGVFLFDIATGAIKTVAVSSSAAALTADGRILALGSQRLTWAQVANLPQTPVDAELALFDPRAARIKVLSLGFQTLPAMLAQSAMLYSLPSNIAAIETYIPGQPVPTRKLITFSPTTGRAFLIAFGPDRGPALISWSRGGNLLAILDSDGRQTTLSVVAPMR